MREVLKWLSSPFSSCHVSTPNVSVLPDLILDKQSKCLGQHSALLRVEVCLPKVVHALDQVLIEPSILSLEPFDGLDIHNQPTAELAF